MSLEIFTYKRYASVAKYSGNDKFVIIPQQYNGVPVTEIREDAFARNDAIEGVFIPSTLKVIGANAFANCYNLEYVGVGLEDAALGDVSALPEDQRPDLENLTEDDLPVFSRIPASVQVVESGAFAKTGIRNIEFMGNSLEIGDSAFEGCQHLEMATFFGCERLMLGKRIFMNSSIVRFYAPKARIDTMPDYAFSNCKHLVSVVVHINAVGTRSFYRCEKLKRLDVSKKFRSIGSEAFEGCNQLEGVNRPKEGLPEKPKPQADSDKLSLLPVDFARLEQEELDALFVAIGKEFEALEAMEREENDMAFQEMHADIEPSLLEQALLRMNIDYHEKMPKPIPTKLKGSLECDDGTFHFSIQAPSFLSEVDMQILTGQSLINVMPIMNYIVKNGMTVVLLGKQDGNMYSVYKILPDYSQHGKDISPDFFHEMIKRSTRPVPKDVDLGAMIPPFTMRTEDEYETFIEICESRLPAWVLQAYNKNKETIRRRSGRLSDDECKHARRAQELLMNIDWLPCVVHVPSSEEVRRILDEEFFGLEPIKERIMEVVAQIRRTGKLPKWGILIHGPAGTGKTSIVKAIARIFGMSLIQLDMSSIGEEPGEVSGSSRIYSNARPGMMVESMFQIRSSTAVLLANEVDKAGEGKSGRCAADILLSILDKTGFYENFLEEIVPTDNLFCIGTCNDLSKISKPLKDRFLVIDIAGYTPAEKKVIFSDYVFPAAKSKSNILPDQVQLEEEALDLLISEYALEPGARDLEQYAERFVGDYCRHSDTEVDKALQRVYTVDDIRDLLGPGRRISRHFAINPGQVNAAFYHEGKAYFFLVEAAVVPGTGKFKALGPMSKIQEEYCEVAYWCARNTISSSAYDFGKFDVAIFVPQKIPEGADNYVGLASYVAICSKLMNTNLAINDTCFIGGCDMNGSLYFDENDLTPLLRTMKARGVSTLYAPMGTNRLVKAKGNSDYKVMIVEAPDAKTLFSLAVAQSSRMH